MSLKRIVKGTVQTAVATLAPALWRWRRGSLLVLMYHRVLPAGHADRATEQPGMYVSPATLALHLDTLRAQFTLLHLDDWLERARHGQPLPPRACAITFDDGWRDNYQYAWPVLRQAGVPATIYLVSDLVGTSYSFWPNMLARLLESGSVGQLARLPESVRALLAAAPPAGTRLGAAQIDQVISACKAAHSDAQMLELMRGVEPPGGDIARDLMDWDEIRELQRAGLVRFGSHTRRHTRLSGAHAPEVLADEVQGSLRAIAEQLGETPRTFCFPNGDTSPAAIACVRDAYLGAVTTAPGWNDAASDRHILKRIGVHDDVSATRAGFLSRLAGVG